MVGYFRDIGMIFILSLLYVIFPTVDMILTEIWTGTVAEKKRLGCRQLRQSHVDSTFYDNTN